MLSGCGGDSGEGRTTFGNSASQGMTGELDDTGDETSMETGSGDGDLSTTSGDGDGDATTTDSSGDGDGDASTSSGDGDGDASTSSGDGDGDGTASAGDGDGDASTSAGDGDGDASTSAGDGDGDGTSSGGDGDGDGDAGDVPGGIDRLEDPVVVLGAQLPGLVGQAVGDIVAFARDGDAWVQRPVQVDERLVQDFCEVYGKSSGLWNSSPACKTDQIVTALFYADSQTFTGPDTDPLLDNDDEVVFMARDAGDRIGTWNAPAGVVAGSGLELELTDGADTGYMYLFVREDTNLDPGAGQDYVSYTFSLDGGIDYLTEYDLYGYNCGGDTASCTPQTEDSTVQSAAYSQHFSARWLTDEIRITAGNATGVDILDVHQARFDPSTCGRHVLTFSTAEGAYIVHKDGPVRALRSYIGANSGPLTQRVHQFYDRREDIITHLRVHSLAKGIMDLFDYSAEAIGMTYTNDLNPGGLTIDGVSDVADESALQAWEIVTGPQGSLVMSFGFDVSFNTDFSHFYWADEQTPSFSQCATGTNVDAPDGSALGTSGPWLDGALPDTDPKNGSTEHVMATRIIYFREPQIAQSDALTLVAGAQTPVEVQARTAGDAGLGDACGDGVCDASESASCPFDCAPVDQTCGDTLCLPPETSTSCAQDCPGGMAGSPCGDGTCDAAVENELSCAPDCWTPYTAPVACTETNCEGLLDACADETECVDLVVCVGPCINQGGANQTCINDCATSLGTSQANIDTGTAMLSCGNMANCF